MRAAVLTRHGQLDALEVREDVPVPTPGSGQVLVRVTAAAINNTDVMTREGGYGLPGEPDAAAGWSGAIGFPRIQGGDIVGQIVQVGTDVDPARLGVRVMVDPGLYDSEAPDATLIGMLGSEADGGFAEYVVVDDARAFDVTNSPLSDEQLACVPMAYGTAFAMLERGELASGETVLVTGASGGVGLALVQLAHARGCRVIALTSAGKAEEVQRAGADDVLQRGTTDLAAAVRSAAPNGLDMVADVIGGPTLTELLPELRPGGRWVIAGAIGGPIVEFDLRRLYLFSCRMIGSSLHTPGYFAQLVELARTGAVEPRVEAAYALEDIHKAQEAFLTRQHIGKYVILPNSSSVTTAWHSPAPASAVQSA